MDRVAADIDFSSAHVRTVLTDPRRLAALDALDLLDFGGNERLDCLVRMAARVLEAPVCLVSLVDDERQYFPARFGSDAVATPLSHSFCQYVVASDATLVVPDAASHPVLRHDPATTEFGVAAYLGTPLRARDGSVVGTLCVLQTATRIWSADDLDLIEDLATAVSAELELRVVGGELRESCSALARRSATVEQLMEELRHARAAERRTAAAAIHDRPLQELVAALMMLRTSTSSTTDTRAIEDCLERAMLDLRGVMNELAPMELPHADASRFVFEAVVETAERFGLSHDVAVHLTDDIEPAAKQLVFRAALELVYNACRHSGGNSVSVQIRSTSGHVRVEVADDGPGWGGAEGGGGGLRLLCEDLADAGGRLEPARINGRFAAVVHVPRLSLLEPSADRGPLEVVA